MRRSAAGRLSSEPRATIASRRCCRSRTLTVRSPTRRECTGVRDSAGRPATRHNGRVTTRVFLLDDHEIVRRGLRELLEAAGDIEVVGEAGTADEAMRRIPALTPDVAVLDVRLPDGDGVTVCRDLRSKMPELRCLMLTSFADDEALFDAI